jgi:DNA-binding response OmpR family regulator
MKDAMILLIEDERQIRRFVRSALENEGLRGERGGNPA